MSIPIIGSIAHGMKNKLDCTTHGSLQPCVVQFGLFMPCSVEPMTEID